MASQPDGASSYCRPVAPGLSKFSRVTTHKVCLLLGAGPTRITVFEACSSFGGKLSLVAKFPDRAPVVLSGIAEEDPTPKPTSRKQHAHAQKGDYTIEPV